PCPWPTGAHIPGEYAATATRSYLRQECERQFSYGAAAAELATYDDESCDVVRFFTEQKCRMMPYLYREAARANEAGTPMMRAMM
ncbi:hypothetical protein ONJ45_27005, partial [Salmonella enterica subsp. enterica serovar Virginia]|nr:hypothetical protein [Salmonella enterica subsp. enterica serovar Virginia]